MPNDPIAVPESLAGERADKVLAVVADLTRSGARTLIDSGQVTADGVPVRPKQRLSTGVILVYPEVVEDSVVEPDADVDFDVLFEDEDMAVIGKPPGLVVHRGAGHASGTLVNGLVHQFPRVVGVGEFPRWGIVHRLDRDTSGAMLVALSERGHVALSDQIRQRLVHRHYVALVRGKFDIETGTVDAPIGRDAHASTKMAVRVDGRYARTHYRRVAEWDSADVSKLDVQLETGRTHQIRVHLAAIGHPIVGDGLYRTSPDPLVTPRIFLHAARLEFDHPFSGEPMDIAAPLPEDLQSVLDGLEG